MTSILNTLRAIFAQQPVGHDVWFALAWYAGLLLAAYAAATAIYRRKVS
ncbi:hypothetical protein [Micromonospora sp. CNB394]